VPLAIGAASVLFVQGLVRGRDAWPFLSALGVFVLSFIGLGISLYPYMVPHALTIAEAAAPDESLWFLLAGALVLLPMILGYTAYAYWVFRGKTEEGEGYH
jgi:cytochrome d ubiquinol oxidase subunit II